MAVFVRGAETVEHMSSSLHACCVSRTNRPDVISEASARVGINLLLDCYWFIFLCIGFEIDTIPTEESYALQVVHPVRPYCARMIRDNPKLATKQGNLREIQSSPDLAQ